ncbi:hypothetical protein IIA16_01425 [bacterium]|nr:hypothetical protein [bacterium]
MTESNPAGSGQLWINLKNGMLAFLFLALGVGLFKVLDASSDYIIMAKVRHSDILIEYMDTTQQFTAQATEIMNQYGGVIEAVEESVQTSTSLIAESRDHVAWINGVSNSLYPPAAQENISGLINVSVQSLTDAVAFLTENPEKVDEAIQRLLESAGEARPFSRLGEALGEVAAVATGS